MPASTLSPDARQVLLALRALKAATAGAVAVSSGLAPAVAAAALEELAVAGEVRCTADGTWVVPPQPAAGRG